MFEYVRIVHMSKDACIERNCSLSLLFDSFQALKSVQRFYLYRLCIQSIIIIMLQKYNSTGML